MRLCAALALVLVALTVVTVKAWPRSHPRARRVAVEAESAPPAGADRHPPGFPSWRAPRARHRPASPTSLSIGHLRGRAVLPAGGGADGPVDLFVTADDGRHVFPAASSKGGVFEFHMPPGRYLLTARASTMVGELRDVVVPADGEREVEIVLGPEARIGGQLRVPDNQFISAVARPSGGGLPKTDGSANAGEGAYVFDGLIPGRAYDLEFSGDGVRTLKLVGITAPSETLDVTMERRALIRVAVGFPRGAGCPIDKVTISRTAGASDPEDIHEPVGYQCHFEGYAPLDSGDVTIVAEGIGWLLETQAIVPAHGDLEPICLNPPCRTDPVEGIAKLRMTLDGIAADGGMHAEVVPIGDDNSRFGCGSSANECDVGGLSAGKAFLVTLSGMHCKAGPVRVTLTVGDNDLRLPCQGE